MTQEIVILSRSLPFHGLGGMEIVAWELSCELARMGESVRVITTKIPDKEEEFTQDGVRVVALDVPAGRYSRAWWKVSRSYFEQHCIESTKAVLSVSAAGMSLLKLKSRMPEVPFLMQAHGTSWGEVLSKWKSRRLYSVLSSMRNVSWVPKDLMAYRLFDTVVAVGERVYHDLQAAPANWALQKSRLQLINNGIDTSVFKPDADRRQALREAHGIDQLAPVLISASRLHMQKGVQHGLRAFAEFLKCEPDAVFLIAGDGPELRSLQELATHLHIEESVRFLGTLPRSQLANWLAASDAFLFLTERIEGLPLNVLEALACGLPAVVSNHLDLFESQDIHMVSPRDVGMVAAKLDRVLSTKSEQLDPLLPERFQLRCSSRRYLKLIEASYIARQKL